MTELLEDNRENNPIDINCFKYAQHLRQLHGGLSSIPSIYNGTAYFPKLQLASIQFQTWFGNQYVLPDLCQNQTSLDSENRMRIYKRMPRVFVARLFAIMISIINESIHMKEGASGQELIDQSKRRLAIAIDFLAQYETLPDKLQRFAPDKRAIHNVIREVNLYVSFSADITEGWGIDYNEEGNRISEELSSLELV